MRNFASFNELSLPAERFSAAQLREFLIELAHTFNASWKFGLRKLRVGETFRSILTSDGLLLEEVLRTLPAEEKGIIYSAADSPHILESEAKEIEDFVNSSVIQVGDNFVDNCEGLLCSFVHKVIAISIPSEEFWKKSMLSVILKTNKIDKQSHDIPHASTVSHISEHIVVIGQLIFETNGKLPTTSAPFPNAEFATKFIANEDWTTIAKQLNNCSHFEKIPRISPTAEKVAIVNGYTFDKETTRKNRDSAGSYRQIFACNSKNGKIYLSTDFEKGAFEVCDKNGVHLGEWTFDGKKHKNAEKSHNILV